MTIRVKFFLNMYLLFLTTVGCQGEPDEAAIFEQPPLAPGVVQLDESQQRRFGIVLTPVCRETLPMVHSTVGWFEAPPGSQSIIRTPVAGFVVATDDQCWPKVGQGVLSGSVVANINVFLTPLEVTQLVTAKEDNDIQMQQAVTTMELSESQLRQATAASEAVTGVRINELKQALAHAKTAFKEATEKIPYLIQEPYERGFLVRPLPVEVPKSGKVTQVHVVPGQFVQGGEPLWNVVDWSTLWLRVPVFEDSIHQIERTKSASVVNRFEGTNLKATPLDLPIETKPLTRMVDYYYQVENVDGQLRVGQAAQVELPIQGDQELLLVPASAILYNGFGQASCYKSTVEGNEFELRRIELGMRRANNISVLRGLELGDLVVTTGAEQIAAENSGTGFVLEDDE